MKNKAIVLFSGGIDSTVCLALAINKYNKSNVMALIIDYGQNNDKELNSAKEICKYYDVKYELINLREVFKYSNSSLIKESNNKIPYMSYSKQYLLLDSNNDVSTNVPFRNGVMFSVCTSYALSKKYNIIYSGIHKEEGVAYNMYPDCSNEFNTFISLAIYRGTNKKIIFESPLINMNKKQIVSLGNKLKIPFEKTWTCYESHQNHCGKCTACMDRKDAFIKNKLNDSIKYEW